jgi:UDP-GlcNAc3NAcA epimerase
MARTRAADAADSVHAHKILTVVGARPQFIKAAVVSRLLADGSSGIRELLVHTGQHFDAELSDVFFEEMGIPRPHVHLGIGGLSHGAMTGRMIEAIENVIVAERPSLVLVYGDTNSTLAGAIAASKLNILVAHVEAGLRSFNRGMPEEINRVLTDHATDVLFAPTRTAVENLRREGIRTEAVHLVGDVMFDAALHYAGVARERSTILERLGLDERGYVLATVHRQENTDDEARLTAIFEGLARVAVRTKVVLPLHPRTRKRLEDAPRAAAAARALILVGPVGYLDMVALERGATAIATDSGGVQKEAFFYGVPCVTLRDETEWIELIDLGANVLAPPVDAVRVGTAIERALEHQSTAPTARPYGDGDAGQKIVAILSRVLEAAA